MPGEVFRYYKTNSGGDHYSSVWTEEPARRRSIIVDGAVVTLPFPRVVFEHIYANRNWMYCNVFFVVGTAPLTPGTQLFMAPLPNMTRMKCACLGAGKRLVERGENPQTRLLERAVHDEGHGGHAQLLPHDGAPR